MAERKIDYDRGVFIRTASDLGMDVFMYRDTPGIYLNAHLEALSRKHGLGGVRGKGLLLALDLKHNIGPAVAAKAMEKGLLINAPRPDSLRFMPALNVTREEIDRMAGVLDEVLAAVG